MIAADEVMRFGRDECTDWLFVLDARHADSRVAEPLY